MKYQWRRKAKEEGKIMTRRRGLNKTKNKMVRIASNNIKQQNGAGIAINGVAANGGRRRGKYRSAQMTEPQKM
jgi:hypothetical protein